MSIKNNKAKIQEYLKRGKDYLAINDLDGFYTNVIDEDILDDPECEDCYDVGIFSKVFADCGVNIMKHAREIHPGMFAGQDLRKVAPSLVHNGVLSFPDYITSLPELAFCDATGFDELDLRGIEYVDFAVFQDCDIKILHLDKGVKVVRDITSFYPWCKTLSTLAITEDMDPIAEYFYKACYNWKFTLPDDDELAIWYD